MKYFWWALGVVDATVIILLFIWPGGDKIIMDAIYSVLQFLGV